MHGTPKRPKDSLRRKRFNQYSSLPFEFEPHEAASDQHRRDRKPDTCTAAEGAPMTWNMPGQVRHWRKSAADLTHEDLHVSEPVSAVVTEMALAIIDMPTIERLEALVGLAVEGYDAEGIEHQVQLEKVRRFAFSLI